MRKRAIFCGGSRTMSQCMANGRYPLGARVNLLLIRMQCQRDLGLKTAVIP